MVSSVTQYSDSGLDAGIPQLHKRWPVDDIRAGLTRELS